MFNFVHIKSNIEKNMFPNSFLGSRADALMDVVVLSLSLIIPIILYSWGRAKAGNFQRHRNIQVSLASVLLVVVSIFEYDMRLHGGIFEMVKGSSYAGTPFLNGSIYFHTFLSISTSLIWIVLIVFSLLRFNNPPRPNSFSTTHKLWGRIGMWDMILTGITGVQLYVFGFCL